ncbi:unnamed protein product [Brassica rapa]|uniref:Uncharacterized protein n=1 Tax=Brassica campestris TaxID=3711 RepID=A0A3P6A663_BRACM|nr:unnamed protein product [Brassica rapa]VDC80031.1 unnamed protein product [Brassica rapa]
MHTFRVLSQSRLEAHNKAVLEMKKKVQASRDLYSFHLEAVQNIVRLHKANSNACLEEVSALTTSSACSIDEFLASGDETTSSLFDELHNALTSHQGEMALFARELRQVNALRYNIELAYAYFGLGRIQKLFS